MLQLLRECNIISLYGIALGKGRVRCWMRCVKYSPWCVFLQGHPRAYYYLLWGKLIEDKRPGPLNREDRFEALFSRDPLKINVITRWLHEVLHPRCSTNSLHSSVERYCYIFIYHFCNSNSCWKKFLYFLYNFNFNLLIFNFISISFF